MIILTYGKVCSTSLKQLLADRFPGDVFYSHGLQSSMTDLVADVLREGLPEGSHLASGFSDNDAIRSRIERAHRLGEPVTIVTGVREPVARSLSVAMQTLNWMHADCLADDPGSTAERVTARLRHLWTSDEGDSRALGRLATVTVHMPFDWLREEIEEPFGFDLLAQPFDLERGYEVLRNGNVRLLIFRMENVPHAVEAGLSELFPDQSFALPKANTSEAKATFPIYMELKRRFSLPLDVLDDIYDHPYVEKFLSPDEIASAKARWQCPEVPATPLRACVAMAVHNHERWVGGHLASLFAQWRPGLDLVVVDDGSTDGSLAAINELLAAHPEIPATVLRNERPRLIGVLDQILALTDCPILIQADSDDVSLPGRLDAILAVFAADPSCRLVTSNAFKVSATDAPLGLLDVESGSRVFSDPVEAAARMFDPRWTGATEAYARSLIEDFPLDAVQPGVVIDALLPLRATLTGTHHYIARPLVRYRQHARNIHRAFSDLPDDVSLERRASIELMLLRQKMRDIERAHALGTSAAICDSAWARARDLFFSHFTVWSDIKARMIGAPTGSLQGPPLPEVAAPPVTTLARGSCHGFGVGGRLAKVASAWTGFHLSEPSGIWTARWALIAFKAPGATALRLRVAGLPFKGPQRVRFGIAGASTLDVAVGPDEIIVSLDLGVRSPSEIVTLIIEATGAAVPADLQPGTVDQRLLGVRLIWIEPI